MERYYTHLYVYSSLFPGLAKKCGLNGVNMTMAMVTITTQSKNQDGGGRFGWVGAYSAYIYMIM